MKITVETKITVERSDGSKVLLGRTYVDEVGDNPEWERAEVAAAMSTCRDQIFEMNSLGQMAAL